MGDQTDEKRGKGEIDGNRGVDLRFFFCVTKSLDFIIIRKMTIIADFLTEIQ